MSGHTKGPWVIDRTGDRHGQRPYGIRAGGSGLTRRNIVNWGGLASPASGETEANARLIAAAPDLLEALVKLAKAVDPLVATPPIVGPVTQLVRDALTDARAAITRADGGGK